MATLTPADYGELRELVYRKGDGKEDVQAWAHRPTKSEAIAIFQAIEDRMVAAAVDARNDIETILGHNLGPDAPSRTACLRKLVRAWMRWRDAHGG